MEMGHGDEIVLADVNFPSVSNAQRLVRSDGVAITELLPAVLQLFPLDCFDKSAVKLMAVSPGDQYKDTIWNDYTSIINQAEGMQINIEFLTGYFIKKQRMPTQLLPREKKSVMQILF